METADMQIVIPSSWQDQKSLSDDVPCHETLRNNF